MPQRLLAAALDLGYLDLAIFEAGRVRRAEASPPTTTPTPMIRSSGHGLTEPGGPLRAAWGAGGSVDGFTTKKCISWRVPAIGMLFASTASTIRRCVPGLRSVNVYSLSVVCNGS